MSIIGSNILAGAAGSGVSAYEIEQSLRFDGTADLVLTTPATTESINAFTMSCWVKVLHGSDQTQFMGRKGAPNNVNNVWLTHNALGGQGIGSYMYTSSINGRGVLNTDAKFRDYSAWMHVHYSLDSSAGNTQKLYVNGVDVTANTDTISGVLTFDFSSTYPFQIGNASSSKFYLAEYHFISGSRPDYTNFGEEDENGVWRPIEYTGSYGNNGMYLKFDPTATNGIGHDHSGTGNHLTATGFTTSGTGTDVMSDTPTKNYATFNLLQTRGSSLSNGNLDASFTAGNNNYASYITQGITSGKYYFEITCNSSTTSASNIGFVGDNNLEAKRAVNTNAVPGQHGTYGRGVDGGGTLYNGSGSSDGSYMAAWSQGDIIMVAIDADNEKFYLGANGKWADGSGNTDQSTLTSGAEISLSASTTPYFFGVGDSSGSVAADFTLNAGQREFAHPPGTTSATDYFNTVLYTGNGSTQSITGVGFQPDLVWIKKRDSSGNHMLTDVITGVNKELNSNSNNAQADNTNALTSFDSDGFSVGSDGAVNINNEGLVAWCWKAGGTASANTDGTIDSSVSANNDANFSVVTFTGTGTAGTVGHGLDTAPGVVMLKKLSGGTMGAGYSDWLVQFTSAGNVNQYVSLNSTSAFSESSSVFGAHPTSSMFSVGNNQISNNSGSEFVAYCWAEKTGVTKIGSYEGNGLVDGPTVDDIGFKPAMVIIKNVDAVDDWNIIDSKRDADDGLRPNSDSAEDSAVKVILTQSGFKVATADSHRINYSGETFVYIAFAENLAVDTDYKALNTANLPAPEVKDGSDYFQTVLYTGNDTTHAITVADNSGNAWGPDFVWIKPRSTADHHRLNDKVRGVNKTLSSNLTNAEYGPSNANLDSFDSDGFTISSSDTGWNSSSHTYVAWNWLAGGSTSSNTNGSVTSTVSVNATAGFSVITYEANGTAGMSIGHGLGVAPDLVICKNRDDVNPWIVWHKVLPETQYLLLNSTDAVATQSDWITTSSTTITWDSLSGSTTTNGSNYVVYAFAEVEGYSKFGSYAGNGDSDGPFVYCGFQPSWVMFKHYSGTITYQSNATWNIYDAVRDTYNVADAKLIADGTNSEATSVGIDILSNGFKLRGAGDERNKSGGNYLFAAFASNPFGGSGVSPATAR